MQPQYAQSLANETDPRESSNSRADTRPIVIPEARIEVEPANAIQTPADIADKYTFIKQLGKGTQGCVYEAIRKSDKRHVAIKVLNISSIQNWKEYDLFWREVETLKSLQISGVAEFYEAIESLDTAAPHAYLVQQCIQGRTLSEMIHWGYRFNVQTVFSLALQLVDIIEQLHQHHPPVIHRDIKPSNIILEPDGNSYKVYLTDFGAVCNPLLQKGGSTVAGTYGYMPPEQLMGHPAPASDIYALGATIAGVLSGMEPSEMMVTDFRLSFEKPLENMPYAIVSCLRRMTMPDVSERLCDLGQIRMMFENFAQGRYDSNDLAEKKSVSAFRQHRMLKKVERLGQKGNYDLWLHLPEQTPRKLPWAYRMINVMHSRARDFWVHEGEGTRLHPGYLIRHPIWWLSNICFWSFVVLLALPFYIFLYYPLNIIVRLFLILIHPFRALFTDNAPPFQAYFLTPAFEDFEANAHKAIRTLIKRGRKTMATVTDIQYIPLTGDCNYIITRADEYNTDTVLKNGYYNSVEPKIYHPRFRLQYTFNPPDDATRIRGKLRNNEEDLIHSIVVTSDPAVTLKPGDMLPILYYFDPETPNRVLSMPYPYPLGSIDKLEHIYCVTEACSADAE